MPMHHWKRVPPAIYHHSHQQWTISICDALNGGLRRAVLEELLLPGVEERGRERMLVAEVRHGDVVDQMAPEDGDLLNRRIVLP